MHEEGDTVYCKIMGKWRECEYVSEADNFAGHSFVKCYCIMYLVEHEHMRELKDMSFAFTIER